MHATHEQMVDFLRTVHARAGGTGAILNLIRASEVRGGADLLTLTDIVSDPQLKMDLAKHAMDAAAEAPPVAFQRVAKRYAGATAPALDALDLEVEMC